MTTLNNSQTMLNMDSSAAMEAQETRVAQNNDGVTFGMSKDPNLAENSLATAPPSGAVTDENWNFRQILNRDQIVSTVTWSNTAVPGTPLAVLDTFSGATIVGQSHRRVLSQFNYFRGNAVFTAQFNGQPFQQGLLKIGFVPMVSAADLSSVIGTSQQKLNTIFALDGQIVSVPDNRTVETTCTYCHPLQYLTFSPNGATYDNTFGCYYIFVITELQSATPTSVDVTITVRFEDVTVAVPRVPIDVQMFGPIDGLLNIAKKVIPIETVTDKFSELLGGSSTMDSVGNTLSGLPYVRRPIGYLNNAKQVSSFEREALDPSSLNLADSSMIPTSEDQMDYKFWFDRPNYERTINWQTGNVKGTLLSNITVHPFNSMVNVSAGREYKYVTPLEIIACVHKFWTGGFIYNFKIVATPYHTGRLLVVMNYGGSINPPSVTPQQAMTNFCAFIDLSSGTREFNFHVPYNSRFPWLRRPIVAAGGGYAQTLVDGWALGTLQVYVLNELKAPPTVNNSVQVVISKIPDDTFALSQLCPYNPRAAPISDDENSGDEGGDGEVDSDTDSVDMTPQQVEITTEGRIGGVDRLEPAPIVLGRKCESQAPKVDFFGEEYVTVKDLFTKYYYSELMLSSASSVIAHPFYQSRDVLTNFHMDLAAIFKSYRAFRGSYRVKFIGPSNSIVTAAFVPSTESVPNPREWNNFVQQGVSGANYVELEAPFNSALNFNTPGYGNSLGPLTYEPRSTTGYVSASLPSATSAESVDSFHAFGDDTRLGLFAFPALTRAW